MSGIQGSRELERVLRQLPRKVSADVMRRSLRVGANLVRKEAIARAPMQDLISLRNKRAVFAKRKYGHLKQNIRVATRVHRGGAVTASIHTGRAFWGLFLEFGTRFMAARPFLTPAFEAKQQEALDRVGDRLGKNIENAAAILAGSYSQMSKAFRRRL